MAKVKHTKNELKTQRDALKRFRRYLPTLQLKKQQLQLEVRQLEAKVREREEAYRERRAGVDAWVRLFAEPVDLGACLRVGAVEEEKGNVAGVTLPVLKDVRFERTAPDLFQTPPWVDDGLDALADLLRLGIELRILREQLRRLAEELRTTSQRVNLFEKLKIPEATENIRVIRIFLGDQMTAEVARSKIAKNKSVEKSHAA